MNDVISRQAAIDTEGLEEEIRCEMCRNQMKTDRGCDGNCQDGKLYEKIMQILNERIKPLPSAQPKQDIEFIKLTVRNSNGRPYYSIIYLEFDDNGVGHDFEGYSSYSLDVISDYLKKYFMPSAQPDEDMIHLQKEQAYMQGWEDSRKSIENLPSAQPEIIRCRDCKHHWVHRCMDSMPTEICDLGQTFYDPNSDFCSLAERRTR